MPYIRFLVGVLILSLLGCKQKIEAKTYMRCELAKDLILKYQISKTFVSNWICLVEHESRYDTSAITAEPNETKNYGIFQINSKNYCRTGRRGGRCNKKCEDFTDDIIDDDMECAKTIFDNEGFKYWRGWRTSCRNTQNLPNLNLACNIDKISSGRGM
ncbi:lysozyme c-1 isoform X2 [Teleopsis dalmanni]|uniref:lysozyme c-1 isoform X2 n=1 Tax=Teleopsis dalmanni TaxID=139649 RepID=UPI0018CD4F06|nr:lysozyme c-1 isoform X2 [Teleopsis dalmanni]